MRKVRLLRRQIVAYAFSCVLILAMMVITVNAAVVRGSRDSIVTEFRAIATYDCILVLGAGLRSDGSPSDMLADRLRAAISLYEQGISERIVLSGDCSGEDYDEVSAMAAYCLDAGVPEDALVRDPIGFSTFESMVNAHSLGYRRIVVVTQGYHLYRALYIANRLDDVEAVGFAADYRTYRGQIFRDVREIVARVKDFWKVTFS